MMITFKNVTVSEVVEKSLTPLIDIREKEEYMMGAIPHAINIPMFGLLMNPDHFLEKDKIYYLICQSGRRTAQTCEVLTQQGFQVVNVLGGTSEYMETYKKK